MKVFFDGVVKVPDY